VEAGGVGGGVFALCALGDEDTDFGRLLLSVIVFSVDALLE
jgi:hypothetical protein